jgi:hypothetical protein
MKHRPNDRQIFALLDGRVSPRANIKIQQHLASCDTCEARYLEIKRLRSLSEEAFQIPEPNWTNIDTNVEKTISKIIMTKQPESVVIFPTMLSVAAAAAVILALFLPFLVQQKENPRLHLTTQSQHLSPNTLNPQPLELTTAHIVDAFGTKAWKSIGRELHRDDFVTNEARSGVRIALGTIGTMETMGPAGIGVMSLLREGPVLRIDHGQALVSTPSKGFTYSRGIEILAGGTTFRLFNGMAEFIVATDEIKVTLFNGEAYADTNSGTIRLEVGHWHFRISGANDLSARWAALDSTITRNVGAGSSLPLETEERQLFKPLGWLPKRLIREAVSGAKPHVQGCYETALKRDPHLILSLEILVRIDRKGTVTAVRPKGLSAHPDLAQCVVRVFKGLSFPPPRGGPAEMVIPYRLYPKH